MEFRSSHRQSFFSFLQTAWGIASSYAVISFLWIYLSDNLLLVMGLDLQANSKFQTWKGTGFVLVTALLLFLLLRSAIKRSQHGEMLFCKVIETIPMGILVVDLNGKIVDCNSAASNLLKEFGIDGYTNIKGWWGPLAAEECGLERALKNGETSFAEKIKVDCVDGRCKTVLYSSFPLTSEDGLQSGVMALIQDVTDKVEAEERLRRFKFSIEQASEAIFWLNKDGRFVFCNEQACRSLGYSQKELMQLSLWDIDSAFPPERWQSQWEGMRRQTQQVFETCHTRKDGSLFPVEVSASQCRFNNQDQHVAFVRDISLRKKYQEQLEHQSNHDDLTGLANRVLLDDRIHQSLLYAERSGKQVAVFLLDLDRFKVINDSLGHHQGDLILIAVSERLAECVYPGDTLSRLGGDEFAIVLSDVSDIADVVMMAQKILNVFDEPFKLGERELRITTSIGASVYPRDGKSSEDLIRHADAAMYQAKSQGGDLFQLCSTEMDAKAHQVLELEADLRQALVIEELILHYQPKVTIATGRISGCEALVRWRHPTKGLVSPGEFIPIAEETGLIIPLGAWVLREACRQFKVWQNEGVPAVKIAVNISARQFLQDDFVEKIQLILTEEGIDPHWLDLELTESMVMQDPDKVAQTLVQLKELGFALSLDDFGTGYSSLNYLRRFPIDSLKIDRSFIVDVAEDKTAASVANSVIGIAHSLGITAVAEGVETWEQYQFLADCSCDVIQGFLFSKPLSAREFGRILAQGKTFGLSQK